MQLVRKADNLTTILCRCHEMWEPWLSGTLWASNVTAYKKLTGIIVNVN